MHQIDRDVLPLRVALQHALERKLTTDTAFFVAAVGVTGTRHCCDYDRAARSTWVRDLLTLS